jgi:hypothetical protein
MPLPSKQESRVRFPPPAPVEAEHLRSKHLRSMKSCLLALTLGCCRFRLRLHATPARTVYLGHGSISSHAYGRLSAKRAVKFIGDFVAADPLRTFDQVMTVLKTDNFLVMRLTPTTAQYIDGPEDAVTVVGCGVTWTLGTAGRGEFVLLDDVQGRAFFKLVDDLRNTIFSAPWVRPSPEPGTQ